MSEDDGIMLAIIFAFCVGVMAMLAFFIVILKDTFQLTFPLKYDEVQSKYGLPENTFKVRLAATGKMWVRGFWVTLDIYKDFLVISLFNRAIVINDLKSLKFSKTWNMIDVIIDDKSVITIALSNDEYKFLEDYIKGF